VTLKEPVGRGVLVREVDTRCVPVGDVGDVGDGSAQTDLNAVKRGAEHGVDGVVAREVDERLGSTEVEGVEEVGTVVLPATQGLNVLAARSARGRE
jgi:hypothetical protein